MKGQTIKYYILTIKKIVDFKGKFCFQTSQNWFDDLFNVSKADRDTIVRGYSCIQLLSFPTCFLPAVSS